MADYSKFYEAREIISGILEKDFVGPVTKDEYLAEIPVQYYIMGKLYPQKNTVKEFNLECNSLLENEIETYDASISLSSQNNPSSMGITIILKPDVNTIYISGSYAFYEPIALEEAPNHNIDTSFLERLNKKPKEIWQRKEFSYAEKIVFSEKKVMYVDLPSDLQLQVYVHSISDNGERVVTIVLLNKNKSKNELSSTAETSKFCAFQPVIKVTGNDDEAIFTNANRQTYLTTDSELLELDMLYSDVTCYAQGHGCSVMWDMEHPEPRWIASSFFPNFNLRQMKAAEIISGEVLSMQFLSSASVDNIVRELEIFVDKYRSWIEEQRKEISTVKKDLRDTAQSNVKKCQDACNRIDYAIKLLGESTKTDGKVFRAFQLANEAMLLQRKQTLLKKDQLVNISG